ncbi:hypothetical protein AALP_AA3G175700 [Arabis alpina]|uniref:Uncharacterized protein n=1 Tax=Arabis alpina TaxID=50452 RepID=A0A087H9V0_ARAAL|nr:hypothetical protein AALP_AA3G175700 [Arabis alpina]
MYGNAGLSSFLEVNSVLIGEQDVLSCGTIIVPYPEAALHAAQNDRLPVRAIIRVFGSSICSITSSPTNPSGSHYFAAGSGARCLSKREMNSECGAMHLQLERLMEKKSGGSNGFFRWKRLGLIRSIRGSVNVEKMTNGEEESGDNGQGFEPRTPGNMKTRLVKGRTTPSRWRKSMS